MPRYPPSPQRGVEASEIRSVTFTVKGMECAACAGSIEKAVKRLPGIKDAAVAVLQERAQVVYHPAFVSEDTIREAIEDAGFEASPTEAVPVKSKNVVCRLRIKGMTCTACSGSIETALGKVPGVFRAAVALATEEAEILHDPNVVSFQSLIEAVEDAGFEAELISGGEERDKVQLQLEGVDSSEAMNIIQTSLLALPGVKEVEMLPSDQRLMVAYDPDVTGPRCLIEIIEQSGPSPNMYKASLVLPARGPDRRPEIKRYFKMFLLSLVF